MPGMEKGDVMGHEFMGEVVEVGADSKHAMKVGDRVVIPFTIICGECEQCQRGNFPVCERSNRNRDIADKMFGHATAGPIRIYPSHGRVSRMARQICPFSVRR